MKKPKIDLSKQGIQQFMLHHVEKIILGLAIALMGVFFWLGFSTKKFDKDSPPEMSKLANRAGEYIVKAGWDELKEYRKGDDKADDRIRSAKEIDISQYDVGRFVGVAAKTRGLRGDPEILDAVPTDLEIHVFKAPVLAMKQSRSDFISKLPDAATGTVPAKKKEGNEGGRGGLGAGGVGFGGDENEDANKEDTLYGDIVPASQELEMGGVRPKIAKVSSLETKAIVTNIVAVNGIIDHKKLYDDFKDTFENAVGWYPPRDKPDYAYIQVQRQGGDGKWTDIGNMTRFDLLDDTFPNDALAPEIVHPDYYDEILTGWIPPITQLDYRRFAIHSKVPQRKFRSAIEEENDNPSSGNDTGDDGFSFPSEASRSGPKTKADTGDEETKKDLGGIRKGSDRTLYEKAMKAIKPKADLKLFRFFDVGVEPGQYKYRVRVWLKDPNNEDPKKESENDSGKPKKSGTKRGAGVGGGTVDAPPGGGRDDEGGRGGANPPGTGGGGQEQEEEAIKYKYTAVDDRMKDVSVRNRIDNEKLRRKGEDPLPETKIGDFQFVNLNYCRPSEWTEFEVNVPGDAGDEFYAGPVSPGKLVKTDNGSVQVGDSSVNLIASVWDSHFDTRVPAYREAFRGDALNVKVDKDHPINLLHPVDWSVRRLDEYEVETDAILVDVVGGESLPIRSDIPVNMPGEILIMDAEGNFRVQDNLRDAMGYRHSLFKEDDSNEFGKRKTPKKKESRDGGGGGRDGGGGGRDRWRWRP